MSCALDPHSHVTHPCPRVPASQPMHTCFIHTLVTVGPSHPHQTASSPCPCAEPKHSGCPQSLRRMCVACAHAVHPPTIFPFCPAIGSFGHAMLCVPAVSHPSHMRFSHAHPLSHLSMLHSSCP